MIRLAELAASVRRRGVGLIVASLLLAPSTAFAQPQPELSLPGPASVADVAEGLIDAVVAIASRQRLGPVTNGQLPEDSPFRQLFDDNLQPLELTEALGSGFVLDPSGIIVTNGHVIDDADDISVVFHDGSRLTATVVGVDPKTDLAVLRVVPPRPLTSVTFAEGEPPRVGDWVMAIGNPFGLGGTVTLGILSARNRDINTGPYDDYLQTDAAINRGNSGGPLFDMHGRVIGVNTAIISNTGDSIGLAFAVPAEMASHIVDQLIELGRTRRGWIGVRIQEVTDGLAEGFGIADARGALIASVFEGGPAEAAGIGPGDIVLTFDGQPINAMRDLPRVVAATEVGRTAQMLVLRRGVEETITVEVGELEEVRVDIGPGQAMAPAVPLPGLVGAEALGLTLAALTPELRRAHEIVETVNGVVITFVAAGSLAAERQLEAGEVILQVGHDPVASPDDVTLRIIEQQATGRTTATLYLADPSGETRFEWIRIAG